jgi:hypothetical protein
MSIGSTLSTLVEKLFRRPAERILGEDNAWIVAVIFEIGVPWIVAMVIVEHYVRPSQRELGAWFNAGVRLGTIAAIVSAAVAVFVGRRVAYAPPLLSVRPKVVRWVFGIMGVLVIALFGVMRTLAGDFYRTRDIPNYAWVATALEADTYVVVCGGCVLYLLLVAVGLRFGRSSPARNAFWPPLVVVRAWQRLREQ